MQRGRLPNPDRIEVYSRLVYRNYRKNAKYDKRSFSLSFQKFKEIASLNCHYCGTVPSQKSWGQDKNTNATPYIYNGIDRKNNEIGYEEDNCLPCCWDCNQAKRLKTYNEFLLWLDRIARFQNSPLIETL